MVFQSSTIRSSIICSLKYKRARTPGFSVSGYVLLCYIATFDVNYFIFPLTILIVEIKQPNISKAPSNPNPPLQGNFFNII